ncbi:hypothetical protein ACFOVU_26620 [Nocardiopsis sediminis]|uniref:Uncharacterized protein n=1 Tax=Nocardiopsis sediminis TaxID=1778267 RepID=A0ABV8FTQ7_9ACTN
MPQRSEGSDGSGIRPRFPGRSDRGAGKIELGAVIALVTTVVGVVLTFGIPVRVYALLDEAICRVETLAVCTPPTAAAAMPHNGMGPENPAGTETSERPVPEGGDGSVCTPLCAPVAGDAEWPEPPRHPEEGAATESDEEFDTVELSEVSGCDGWTLCLDHELQRDYRDARDLANSWAFSGREYAGDALRHFLGASGGTMEIDGEELLSEVPEFGDEVAGAHTDLGLQAIAEAREQDADGPVTFPVNTGWNSFGTGTDGTGHVYDDPDWAAMLGTWMYNHTGVVTAYPPSAAEGDWSYEITAQTNIRKYYDWDPEATEPVTGEGPDPGRFSEQDLWNMHRAGIAREFWIEGAAVTSSRGDV